ncbi:general secretion pathway protein GspK [Sphingomonas sp. DT-204]|uniref:general secretion pathway protein GspK n=1 Tax=Sphingomonas sp. DT-204 TaxID=3396166 RepID=UPI003F541B30
MILINVLMFVAIAAGLVLLMVDREELALDRALRTREAARAQAVVRGGELSAVVALRRDAAEQRDYDAASEPWGALAESGAPIEGGSFDLVIADAEGRFNLNALMSGQAAPVILFGEIAHSVGLDEEQIAKAVAFVRLAGPVTDLRPLRFAGLDPEVTGQLERLVAALPGQTQINLNAASPEMLAILFHDPVVADRLVKVRERQGMLTMKDLADENVTMPPATGFRSSTFWVRTRATIGDTVQQGATLIQRRPGEPGAPPETVAVERWWNAAIPPDAPAFPARKN